MPFFPARSRQRFVLFLLAVPLSLPVAFGDTIRRTLDAQPGGTLELVVDRGSVNIQTTEEPQVTVEVERDAKRATEAAAREVLDAHRVEISREAGHIRVRSTWHGSTLGGLWGKSAPTVKYTVTVPRRFDIEVQTAGGSIRVADMEGTLQLRTAGGSIETGHIDGTVKAQTSGGSIRIRGATGRVDAVTAGGSIQLGETQGQVHARTSGGSISMESATDQVDARTSGGSIRVDRATGGVDAQTSGGSIRIRYTATPSADSHLQTVGGGIRIELDDPVAVQLDARAVGGGVQSKVPVESSGKAARDHLEGTLRGGGPLLKVRTTGGSIRIEPGSGVQ